MFPINNNIHPISISNNDITPFKSDHVLINQWQEWAKNAQSGVGEQMDIALVRLMDALEHGSTYLDLSRLNLTALPKDFPPSLEKLNVSGNQLTCLPETLPKSLKELYAGENQLRYLPETLPDSLEYLMVYNNRLTSLPDVSPKSLKALKSLNISYNKVASLPEGLPGIRSGGWGALASPDDVTSNYIQLISFPENLPGPSSSEWGALTDQWQECAKYGQSGIGEQRGIALVRLMDVLEHGSTYLDLSRLNLTALPKDFPPSLKSLDVRHNQLTFMPDLPRSLTLLDVSGNPFTSNYFISR